MAKLHGSLIWYELMTTDADGARAFYKAAANLAIGAGQGDRDYAMIEAPDAAVGGMLPLTQEMCDHGARPTWLMYVGVDDVDATVAAIEAAGGRTWMPAWDIPQGRIAMVADPEGAPFYVMKPTPPSPGAVSTAFSPTRIGHCTWNELRAADLDAALDFYGKIFGWEVTGSMSMGPMGDYKFLGADDVPIGAVMGGATAEKPAWWLNYFRVADIDDAIAAVKANGGQVLNGPHPVPGGDMVIICTDHAGAGVGFVARS
jgi:predicted enzyme related to lactoylglutathione lyase